MGWDAFGMPAENAAIENKTHPAVWTGDNIAVMRRELSSMGLSYDWTRELATCDPSYYRHGAEDVPRFPRQGLGVSPRVLGQLGPGRPYGAGQRAGDRRRGWRSGAIVEKRKLPQWMLRITAYADDFVKALARLERWPERVRLMQENWIGARRGCAYGSGSRAAMTGSRSSPPATTPFRRHLLRPSPNHPLAEELAGDDPALAAFIVECNSMGTSEEAIERAEKKGHETRLMALHPSSRGASCRSTWPTSC